MLIRKSVEADKAALVAIVNDAAQAYRGVIPADRWREPYMPAEELEKEIAGASSSGWRRMKDACPA